MAEVSQKRRHLTSFQIIILGFIGVILAGAILLMLPLSSKSGAWTPFLEALFTSTSAVCVTGLVVHDTAAYWSVFGQAVILLLIQVGGLGVITIAVSFALLSGRKITLMQRSTMQEAISAPKVGGIVRLTGFVLKGTMLIELLGAFVMAPVFLKDFGLKGIWMSMFHSVSAFCNAGFDLMGKLDAQYTSLTSYAANSVITITVMVLIIVGGIGFLTWEDVCVNRCRFRHYRMQSKVILTTTCVLILIPFLLFFFLDFSDYPLKERLLNSAFQAITPRTAGFNTVSLTQMNSVSQALIIVLMLIGGSPGSTAGGMKTTTIAVLLANTFAGFRREENPQLFHRRIEAKTVNHAATILMMYAGLFFAGAVLISISEKLPMGICLFESASAVGTVGLTMGITPGLGKLSQCVLIFLMFLGRVGGLTLIYAALPGRHDSFAKYPLEKITVG